MCYAYGVNGERSEREVLVATLEGIDYALTGKMGKTGLKRGRRKPTDDELAATRAAVDQARAASDEIRKKAGLDSLPENFFESALKAECEKRGAK